VTVVSENDCTAGVYDFCSTYLYFSGVLPGNAHTTYVYFLYDIAACQSTEVAGWSFLKSRRI